MNLTHYDDAEALIRASDTNLASYWTAYGTAQGRKYHRSREWSAFATGIPFPLFNGVFQANFSPDQLEHSVSQATTFLAGAPAFWWCSPLDQPEGLDAALKTQGWIEAGKTPGMKVRLAQLPADVPTADEFQIELVCNTANLREWVHVLARANDIPESLDTALYELELALGYGSPDAPRRYLGRHRGKAVSVSLLHLTGGVAGIYAVGTLPEARGLGFGAAITLRPYQDAYQEGYAVGILQSSPMGYPMYQRLGFEHFYDYALYLSPR